MVHIDFTMSKFPATPALKDDCGLPFGCVIQPYATLRTSPLVTKGPLPKATSLPRCGECFAYINCHCGCSVTGWSCALCGNYNDYTATEQRRFGKGQARDVLLEISEQVYEVDCDDPADGDGAADIPPSLRPTLCGGPPTYLSLVDVTAPEEALELVRSGLRAAVEALPPGARFGLLTFDTGVGMWDCTGADPLLKHVDMFQDGECPAALADVLPLEWLLCSVDEHKDCISAAIEAIQPDSRQLERGVSLQDSMGGEAAPQHFSVPDAGEARGRRGFGNALQSTLQYLGEPEEAAARSGRGTAPPFRPGYTRLMVYLAGEPDFGPGSLQEPSGAPDGGADTEGRPPAHGAATRFYQQTAVAAAALGISVDMIVVCGTGVGLEALLPLSTHSGGSVFYYMVVEGAQLAEDVYKRISSPHAVGCLLRVRTTPEFKAGACFGRCFRDATHPEVLHVSCCGPHDAVALELEFCHTYGFLPDGANVNNPVIQVAFQYSVMLPAQPGAPAGAGPSLQRRLRVATHACRVAHQPKQLYGSANANAITCLLMHKLIQVAAAEGEKQARLMLEDWLIILVAQYNHHAARLPFGGDGVDTARLDIAFSEMDALAPLTRLAYAMLRGPLFAGPQEAQGHPDLTEYLRHVWAALPPGELQRAVYPLMASFADVNQEDLTRHALSRVSLQETEAPLWLIDAYLEVLIFCRGSVSAASPFPPPQKSSLAASVKAIQRDRRITPAIRYMHEDEAGASSILQQYFIDDPDESGDQRDGTTMGLVAFLAAIESEVVTYASSARA